MLIAGKTDRKNVFEADVFLSINCRVKYILPSVCANVVVGVRTCAYAPVPRSFCLRYYQYIKRHRFHRRVTPRRRAEKAGAAAQSAQKSIVVILYFIGDNNAAHRIHISMRIAVFCHANSANRENGPDRLLFVVETTVFTKHFRFRETRLQRRHSRRARTHTCQYKCFEYHFTFSTILCSQFKIRSFNVY